MRVFLFLSFLFSVSFCAAQVWGWASAGTTTANNSEAYAVTSDGSGNVFITGYYNAPITFSPFTLSNPGGVYLVKYDPNGNVLWARSSIGGGYYLSVCADPSGNVYLTGAFNGSSIVFGSYTLTNTGVGNAFLVKYDMNGNVLWARSSVGNGNDRSVGVSVDVNGNPCIAGMYNGSSICFGNFTLTPNGGASQAFLTKYDPNGNVLWARSSDAPIGASGVGASAVSTADPQGNIFVSGYFGGPEAYFGSFTLTSTSSPNFSDFFLAKYDMSGNLLWVKDIYLTGTDSSNIGSGCVVNANISGNAFLGGFYSSTSLVIDTYTLNRTGGTNAFLVSFLPGGNVQWARTSAANGYDGALSLCSYSNGIYLAGFLSSTTVTFGTVSIQNPGGLADPAFIVKYDLNGNALCGFGLSSGGDDEIGVSNDVQGNAYLSGDFYANPFVLGTNTFVPGGGMNENIFTAKFNCSFPGPDELRENSLPDIYPNPVVNDHLTIKSETGIKMLDIYDLFGRKVLSSGDIHANECRLNLEGLTPGIYFVSVVRQTTEMLKIIVGK